MLRVATLASGSSGNCAVVSDGRVHILIDAGISTRRIAQGLKALGTELRHVSGVLITHEHTDHVSALPVLCRQTGAALYTAEGTACEPSMAGADRAVVVTTTESSSLRDAQRTVMELNGLGRGQVHLVVNRCRKKLLKSLHQTIDDAIDSAGLPLLGVIPEDETMPLYAGRGVPLLSSGNNYAAKAYRNIAKRIDGQRVSLMQIR